MWRDYFAGLQREYRSDEYQEGVADYEGYKIEVTRTWEPGPFVEIRILFNKLYGDPGKYEEMNPHRTESIRLRAKTVMQNEENRDYDYVVGTSTYKYWPSLNLGYIESAVVNPKMRKKGIGITLINFIIEYLRSKGCQRIYSFAVNREGYRLLINTNFIHEPPEDPANLWRRWFFYNINHVNYSSLD
ncbi:MAG: GNAT family N-acetyltransferase [Dehalococcoidales bacterium]|nr:GNAT family N-acetyltransferase [Dehalococcoidales bacterium]